MAWVPRFKLYAVDGLTLVYTFLAVQDTNIPSDPTKSHVVEGLRGNGCIIIPGSQKSWDLTISGILLATDYTAVAALIEGLVSVIPVNTKFVLTFDKTESTKYSYNVMRIEPIQLPPSLRTDYQDYTVILKANSW